MAELRDKILLRRSSVLSKRPELYDIDNGELALNYNSEDPGLYFKALEPDGTRKIRKIGPIHFGPTAPNADAEQNGYYLELSNGECWIDSSSGDGFYSLKAWDSSISEWIEIPSKFKKVQVGTEGETNNLLVLEVIGDVEVQGGVNAESLSINSNEVWHIGNKPSLGDLLDVNDENRVNQSVVVFNETEQKYVVNDINTLITITDGGNF
jgi:hypothetical protein